MKIDVFGEAYKSEVRTIARSLESLQSSPSLDRSELVRNFEQISIALRSAAVSLLAIADPTAGEDHFGGIDGNMCLYEDMVVYNLLRKGWGIEYYSTEKFPDLVDFRLFRSLVVIVEATTSVMEGFDLNKRATEALALHAEHHIGAQLAQHQTKKWTYLIKILGSDLH